VTATQIIEEIKHLTPKEQAQVIQFANRLDAERELTGRDLAAFARRMTETTDPAEAAMVRETIVHGFYGGKPHAHQTTKAGVTV